VALAFCEEGDNINDGVQVDAHPSHMPKGRQELHLVVGL